MADRPVTHAVGLWPPHAEGIGVRVEGPLCSISLLYGWTGQTLKWQEAGQLLYELLELREDVDTQGLAMQARLARRKGIEVVVFTHARCTPSVAGPSSQSSAMTPRMTGTA